MGLGGQSSKQSSSQAESGYGYDVTNQGIWGGQSPFLTDLFGQALGMANQQQGQIPGVANALAGQQGGYGNQGMAALGELAQGGGRSALYADPNNSLARQQLSDQADQIGQQFNRVVMPALNSAAGMAGGMGGSRNAIGRGLAASDAQSQIAQAGTDLYSQQYGIGAQSAAASDQTRLQAGQALPGMATSMYNLGMAPFSAQWAPLTALAQIIGSPQVLTQSQGQQFRSSTGKSSGKSLGFNFSLF